MPKLPNCPIEANKMRQRQCTGVCALVASSGVIIQTQRRGFNSHNRGDYANTETWLQLPQPPHKLSGCR